MTDYDFDYVSLDDRLNILEEKYSAVLSDLKRLELENVELTNCLYELENRLQAQIDNQCPKSLDLSNYTLGDS